MEILSAVLEAQIQGIAPALPTAAVTTSLVALFLQQAMEKIDRLRRRASGLLHRLFCSRTRSAASPELYVDLAYKRICHGASYSLMDPSSSEVPVLDPLQQRPAWPPEAAGHLLGALRTIDPCEDYSCDKAAVEDEGNVFDALLPLLSCESYRPSLVRGIVVSLGGITEYTAKKARRAMLQYMQNSDSAASGKVCSQLLVLFDGIGTSKSDAEGKRLAAPLLTTIGIFLSSGCFPLDQAPRLMEKSVAAVSSSRDISRLRASISVFVGLLQWRGCLRRQALEVLLQFLGFSFPTVRQATARALYIRLLEETGAFDVGSDDDYCEVPEDALAEVLESMSTTPWGTDNDAALVDALQDVYQKLGLALPSGGRSMLASRRLKPTGEGKQKESNEYADLVREHHY